MKFTCLKCLHLRINRLKLAVHMLKIETLDYGLDYIIDEIDGMVEQCVGDIEETDNLVGSHSGQAEEDDQIRDPEEGHPQVHSERAHHRRKEEASPERLLEHYNHWSCLYQVQSKIQTCHPQQPSPFS